MITLEAWENDDFDVLVNGEIVGQINHEDVQTFLNELKHIDKMLEALTLAKTMIESHAKHLRNGSGYQKICAAIKKARGEGMDENVRSHIGSVITLDELGIDVEVMDITGEVDAAY